MTIKDLECFYVTCQEHSITKAARHLYITPQGLSKTIKNLEFEFQTKLLNRTTSGITLTETGKYLYEHLPQILNSYYDIYKDIQKINQRQNREIDLLSAYGILRLVTPECISAFKKEHPDVANAYRNEILAGAGTDAAGSKAAVDAERARIKAIDDIALPGFEDLANKAKYEEPVSAEAFAMQIVAEQKKTGQAFLSDREEDITDSGVKDVNPVSNKGGTGKSEDPFGDIIDQMYPEKN